jgi:uncharacterized membrane protein YjjP (DUF1212 family)
MTKKKIIAILKAAKTATIAFDGRTSAEEVTEARQDIINEITARVTKYNIEHPEADIQLVVTSEKIVAGTQTVFLPKMPLTGDVCVKSHTYMVAGVVCCFTDIVANSLYCNGKMYRFQTKAGNIIIISK